MARHRTTDTGHFSSNAKMVRLKKPHPCGGAVFAVVREGPVVTLRCGTCGSIVRMTREKYKKTVVRRQE